MVSPCMIDKWQNRCFFHEFINNLWKSHCKFKIVRVTTKPLIVAKMFSFKVVPIAFNLICYAGKSSFNLEVCFNTLQGYYSFI